jgi:hypothetical protein
MPYKDPEKRKECARKKNKKYREKNLEVLRAKARERWAMNNPPKPKKPTRTDEERRAYQRAYYQANKERITALTKKWQQENKERMREIVRDWQKKNPERFKELTQRYRANNKEHIRQVAKEGAKRRFAENPEKVREARKALKARQMVKDPDKYLENRRRYVRVSGKRRTEEIRDGYVAHLLAKSTGFRLQAENLPKELIEAKRLQLLIRRELNEERK